MPSKRDRDKYAEAGVDIEAGNRFVQAIKPIVNRTFKSGVITDIGGFAGLFSLNLQGINKPVLVSSTDGVGTKLKIAFMMDKHDTVGIDLVAMCVNDILVQGAVPLFMLDYISMSSLNIEKSVEIVKGIAAGCLEANCSLIGGETAEMPGFYQEGEYDLVGFVVGLVDNERILDGSETAVGCKIIGAGSSGLHSNGYSLVRKVFFQDLKMSVTDYIEDFGRTLGEELLQPTKIYRRTILNIERDFHIYALSHVTGGGLTENIPRVLPKQCKAVIRSSSWTAPAIFSYLREAGKIPSTDMMRTFNNGIGLVIVIGAEEASEVVLRLKAMGETAYLIGSVEPRQENEAAVQFVD